MSKRKTQIGHPGAAGGGKTAATVAKIFENMSHDDPRMRAYNPEKPLLYVSGQGNGKGLARGIIRRAIK